MGSCQLQLDDEQRTQTFGRVLAECLAPGDIVTLEGDLGAGKTTLVRAVARALGVPEEVPVTSPTFVLVHELQGRVPVVHADLYRLGDPDELVEVGLREHLGTEAIAFIEWGERFVDALGAPSLVVRLAFVEGTSRVAELTPYGSRGQQIVQQLREVWRAR